jgi:exodeoxyribonuclease VII small subunit
MSNDKIEDPRQFEQSMQELEALVDKLEQGELSLEASLAAFERGIALTRTCQQALDAAEQRVRILTERSETAEPEPFSSPVTNQLPSQSDLPADPSPNDASHTASARRGRASDE